jgi:hypothetical protein
MIICNNFIVESLKANFDGDLPMEVESNITQERTILEIKPIKYERFLIESVPVSEHNFENRIESFHFELILIF